MEGVGLDVAGQRREVLNQTHAARDDAETHGLLNPYNKRGLRHDGRPDLAALTA